MNEQKDTPPDFNSVTEDIHTSGLPYIELKGSDIRDIKNSTNRINFNDNVWCVTQ